MSQPGSSFAEVGQIVNEADTWKLWSSRWNRSGEHRRPRRLYLADRNVLVDDPKDKVFTPLGDSR
jgi:hypothetical protein